MIKPRRVQALRLFSSARLARNTAEGTSADAAKSSDATPVEQPEAPAAANTSRSGPPMSRNAASHSHRKAFVQWVNGPGRVYAEPAKARNKTNYLDGKTHPFPLNPAFQPTAPLARSIKDEIVEDWKSGVGLRQLSTKYGVSLERIDAILKLQQVREKWDAQGRRTMQSYADTMEQVLGTVTEDYAAYEPRHNLKVDPGRQIFTLIPEAASYTSEDAAEELGKTPFGKRQEEQVQKFLKRSTFESGLSATGRLKPQTRDPVEIQPPNAKRADRWSFKIRDAGGKEDTVLRKQDGSLVKIESKRPSAGSKWTMSV